MRRLVSVVALLAAVACAPGRFRPPVTEGTFVHDPQTHRIDGGVPGMSTNRAIDAAPALPSRAATPVTINIVANDPLTQADADYFRRILADYLPGDSHGGSARTVNITLDVHNDWRLNSVNRTMYWGGLPVPAAEYAPHSMLSGVPAIHYSIVDATGRVLEARNAPSSLYDPHGPKLLGAALADLHAAGHYIAGRVAATGN